MSDNKIEAITPIITVEDNGNGNIKLWFGSPGKAKTFGHISKRDVVRMRNFLTRVLYNKDD